MPALAGLYSGIYAHRPIVGHRPLPDFGHEVFNGLNEVLGQMWVNGYPIAQGQHHGTALCLAGGFPARYEPRQRVVYVVVKVTPTHAPTGDRQLCAVRPVGGSGLVMIESDLTV